jgi:hypothetical protein
MRFMIAVRSRAKCFLWIRCTTPSNLEFDEFVALFSVIDRAIALEQYPFDLDIVSSKLSFVKEPNYMFLVEPKSRFNRATLFSLFVTKFKTSLKIRS